MCRASVILWAQKPSVEVEQGLFCPASEKAYCGFLIFHFFCRRFMTCFQRCRRSLFAAMVLCLTVSLNAAAARPGRITLGGGDAGCTFWPVGVDYAWQDWGNDFATAGWATRWPTIQTALNTMAADGVHAVRWWVFTDFGSSPNW